MSNNNLKAIIALCILSAIGLVAAALVVIEQIKSGCGV